MHPDPELDRYLDDLIAKIAAAQEDDGYLYTARTLGFTNGMTGPERWTQSGGQPRALQRRPHVRGRRGPLPGDRQAELLDVAIKNADFLAKTFGPEAGQLIDVPGHQEIEIGLVKLYRATGEREVPRAGQVLHRHARAGRQAEDLRRVLPGPQAGGRADRGGRPRGARRLPVQRRGRRGRADRRPGLHRAPSTASGKDMVSTKLYLTGGVGRAAITARATAGPTSCPT